MEINQRYQRSVGDHGDIDSVANQLVTTGTRHKDGRIIKRGIELYRSLGLPWQHILALVRHLVQEAKIKK